MISALEIRHIIESAFLPLRCTCTASPSGYLTLNVTDPETGRIDLVVAGVALSSLNSSRALSDLIAELRAELQTNQLRASASRQVAPGRDQARKING